MDYCFKNSLIFFMKNYKNTKATYAKYELMNISTLLAFITEDLVDRLIRAMSKDK